MPQPAAAPGQQVDEARQRPPPVSGVQVQGRDLAVMNDDLLNTRQGAEVGGQGGRKAGELERDDVNLLDGPFEVRRGVHRDNFACVDNPNAVTEQVGFFHVVRRQ